MKNMKKLSYMFLVGIITVLSWFSFLGPVYAKPLSSVGTVVGGDYFTDQVWTKLGSPYIVSGEVHIADGYSLTIESGVTVNIAPDSSGAIYINNGKLLIRGIGTERVSINGIQKFHISSSTVNVSYADFNTTNPGLILYWSNTNIDNSSFTGSSGTGMYIWSSTVNIRDSKIYNNNISGIAVVPNASGRNPAKLFIHNSIIVNNGSYSIDNKSFGTVQAEDNWWGSPSGPNLTGTDKISGNVVYTPWLEIEPDFTPKELSCCSSILFIPGLQASRLHKQQDGIFGLGKITNDIWEPNRNDDVRKLFLDSDGNSLDQSIYAGQPIDKAYGLVGIYDSFINFMNNLAEKDSIKEWKSFGYDWRLPITEVVAGQTKRATSTEMLLETVENLAKNSKTGKVSIIAHSNGGLVAKFLVKTLESMGKENLIDSVISVAVPYLGTPQSIAALLYGDKQAILAGSFLTKNVAKELGLNMPSAYTLLPSTEYFSKILGPSIVYASSTIAETDSYNSQKDIIGQRTNAKLLNIAEIVHDLLDQYVWPATITKWAIIGWGKLTTKSIVINEKTYFASTTALGDGTVVSQSAGYNDGRVASINLKTETDNAEKDFVHSNILETPSSQKIINNIITATSSQSISDIENKISSIPSVSLGEPNISNEIPYLVVSTHSPVDLHIYDSFGNHTGLIDTPSGLDIEDDLYTFYDNKIPGSDFRQQSTDTSPETYISIPDDTKQSYSVNIKGNAIGEFTFMVQRIRGDEILSRTEYVSLPVTPLTVASTTVFTGQSSTNLVNIDVDGNGSIDIQAQPNSTLDEASIFDSLRKLISTLKIPNKTSADLLKRIEKIELSFKKNKIKNAITNIVNLQQSLGHKKLNSITQNDKEMILKQIEQFLIQFESNIK